MDILGWLILFAVIAVIAVYVYNRREEARFRRESERAFGGPDGDALMESDLPRAGPGERIEPQLQAGTAHEAPGPAHRREPRAIAEPAPEMTPAAPGGGSIASAMARVQTAAPLADAGTRAQRVPEAALERARPAGDAAHVAPEGNKPAVEAPRPPAEATRAQPDVARPAAPVARPAPTPPRVPAEVAADPICYCAELYAGEPVTAAALDQLLRAVGALSPRVRLEGRRTAAESWQTMERGAFGGFGQVRACLQLVDRRGVVTKQDVIVFQSAVARCAASVPASANIPEAEPALVRARELDSFCEEVDVAVGINLVAPRGRPFLGTRLRGLAEAAGFRLAEGAFAYPDAQGGVRFTLENQEPTRLLGEALRNLQTSGVTLLLDVPRLADGVAAFDEMVAVGRQLAQSLGGTLVDDNSVPVSENGLEQIRNQLRAIYARMQAQGIPAGSPLALRLFS
jgi:hypothetical protein